MKKNSIIKGMLFIYTGILIAGVALSVIDISLLSNGWWTIFIIIPAVIQVLFDGMGSGRLILISMCILILLAGRGQISYVSIINAVIPLLLIIWGLDLIFKSIFNNNQEASQGVKIVRHITGTAISIIFLVVLTVIMTKISDGTNENIIDLNGSYSVYNEEYTDIDKFVIDAGNASLTIIPGDSLMVYSDNLHSSYSIYSEGSTLNIEKDSIFNLAEIILGKWESITNETQITITIPKELYLDRFEIECGSRPVYIEGVNADEFIANFGSGTADIIDCSSGEAVIDTKSGMCYFQSFIADSFELDSSSGTVTFESSEINGLELNSGSGMFYYSGKITGESKVSSGSGSVTLVLDGDIDEYYINGEAGSGGIWINGGRKDQFTLGEKSVGNRFKINGGSGRVSIEISR